MNQQEQNLQNDKNDPTSSNEMPQTSSPIRMLPNQLQATTSQEITKNRSKPDISGGWTKTAMLSSYLAGALKHAVYKPRGKPSNVWERGMHAVCKADNTVIENWYICKRKNDKEKDCNDLFNLKLSHGNSRLREHCEKHDKDTKQDKLFLVSYDQMISALDKANLLGDSYGLISFRKILPRPEDMGNW